VPKGAKTTPFGNQDPAEIPCFVSGLRVAVKTAKPLCAGSIPARASNTFSNLKTRESEAEFAIKGTFGSDRILDCR
jgi:hypothetical protein